MVESLLWKGGEWKDKQPSAREEERFAPTCLLLFHCLFHCALWDIICVWIFCLHVCLCTITGQRTSWIPLELESQRVVNHSWVLGIELGSFERADSVFTR